MARTVESTRVTVTRLGPTIGGEVHGLDFAHVDDDAAETLRAALMEHKVLVFRDAAITPEQQVDFGRRFGELTVHPFTPHLEHLPEVMVLDNHADNPVFATDNWHSDETFRVEPPMGSILRCLVAPEVGGDTLWADMCAAYDGLSETMKRMIDPLEAVHDFKPFRHKFDHLPDEERHRRLLEMERELPNPTHPLVRTHPVTGRKVLFVNEHFTVGIKGMPADEGRALLDYLCSRARIPEYQLRVHWAPNTMVFWDNRPTQHYAVNDYYPQRRTMHRVTIKGDRPR